MFFEKTTWGAVLLTALVLGFMLLFMRDGFAVDNGQWENQPPEVRAWYRNAQLTELAQKRFQFKNCCDHSDVVRTKFAVGRSNGHDVWYWLNPTTMQFEPIPADIVHWYDSAPGGEPTLFIYQGQLTCFYPPNAGI